MRPAFALSWCPLLLVPAAPAFAATHDTQFWATEMMTLKMSGTDSLTLDASQRARSDRTSGGEQTLHRLSYDHALLPKLQIGGGFAYLDAEPVKELRLHQQVVATHGIVQSRTRLEQRFFSNTDTASWRLRQRIQLAKPLDADKDWTLMAAGEAFFHLNRARPDDATGLAVFRLQAGLRRAINRHVDVQLLYMRQQTIRDGGADAIAHVPWLTLSWRA